MIGLLFQVPDPSKAVEYRKGYVMRKCCTDPDGRKSECNFLRH